MATIETASSHCPRIPSGWELFFLELFPSDVDATSEVSVVNNEPLPPLEIPPELLTKLIDLGWVNDNGQPYLPEKTGLYTE